MNEMSPDAALFDGDARSSLEEHLKQEHLLNTLKAHQGWKLFEAYVRANAGNVLQELSSTSVTAEGVYIQEFRKGKANGMLFSLTLLDGLIESIEANIAILRDNIEEKEDASRDNSSGGDTSASDPDPDALGRHAP